MTIYTNGEKYYTLERLMDEIMEALVNGEYREEVEFEVLAEHSVIEILHMSPEERDEALSRAYLNCREYIIGCYFDPIEVLE